MPLRNDLCDNEKGRSVDSHHILLLLLQILGAFAEFERKIIRSRQAEGIARARERNAYKGRQATIDRGEINKLFTELKSVSKVAKAMNICRNSVYRNLEKVAL